MKNIITLIILIGLFNSHVDAQCELNNMTIDISPCTSEDSFTATINFSHAEASDSFTLSGNGTIYGNFAYTQLPLEIADLPGNCFTQYEFIATDVQNPDCTLELTPGQICCNQDCNLEIVDLDVGNCIDGKIALSFDVNSIGNAGDSLEVFSGQEMLGTFSYDSLPLDISDFPTSGGAVENLIVCGTNDTSCCDTIRFQSTCGCSLMNLSAEIIECNLESSEFYVQLDLDNQMSADSFLLGGNTNNYGVFAYDDLPVTVGPLPFSESIVYEFVFADLSSSLCFEFVELGIVNSCISDCVLSNAVAQASSCHGDTALMVDLSFDTNEFTSDSFTVMANGLFYGTFAYGEEVYSIGPVSAQCENEIEFTISDQINDNCRTNVILDNSLCCQLPCPLDAISASLDCANNNLIMEIFTNDSGESDTVDIYLNGNLTYRLDYAETNFSTPIPDSISYPLLISAIDPINGECVVETEISSGCSSCDIGELSVEFTDCNDEDELYFSLDFVSNQPEANKFSISVADTFLGFFTYQDRPVSIGPIKNPGEEILFVVSDSLQVACADSIILDPIICESSNQNLLPEGTTYRVHQRQLVIENNTSDIHSVMLTTLGGRRCWKEKIQQNYTRNLKVKTGVYILSFITKDGLISKKIFIL